MNIRNVNGMLYIDYYVEGKRVRRSTKLEESSKNRKIIKNEMIPKIQAKILLGEYGRNRVKRLKQYIEMFLKEKQELRSYMTKKARTDVILAFFKDVPVDRITRADVKRFLKSLKCKNITKKEYLTDLRGVLHMAIDEEVLDKNPCNDIKIGRFEAPEIDPFLAEEVSLILESVDDLVLRNYLGIAFYQGMRSGEIIGLMHSDVDDEKLYIRRSISKGIVGPPKTRESKRTIPIFDAARPYIEDQMKRSNSLYLFHREKEHLYDVGSFRKRWKQVLEKSGVRYRKIYNTRHSFITAMLNSGEVPILDIAKLVGNSPKIIFKNYAGWVNAEHVKIDVSMNLFGHDMDTVENEKKSYAFEKASRNS